MTDPTNEILFYSEKGKYGEFSNFYPLVEFVTDRKKYATTEAYFQSMKFVSSKSSKNDLKYADIIAKQKTGTAAANLGRQKNPQQNYAWAKEQKGVIEKYKNIAHQREDWNDVKDNVMRRAVFRKFMDVKLLNLLNHTENKRLYEHTHRDDYWGDGVKKGETAHGNGKNKLGLILEETRYLVGGMLADRKENVVYWEKANWVIPGMLIASALPTKEFVEKQNPNVVISLLSKEEEKEGKLNYRGIWLDAKTKVNTDGDFCMVSNRIYGRYRLKRAREIKNGEEKANNDTAKMVALMILRCMGLGYTVLVHCHGGKGRALAVSSLVLAYLYEISNPRFVLVMIKDSFSTRENKHGDGSVMTSNEKVEQLTMILKEGNPYRLFEWR